MSNALFDYWEKEYPMARNQYGFEQARDRHYPEIAACLLLLVCCAAAWKWKRD